jgi:glucose-1-phosphate cytidylyltransferase
MTRAVILAGGRGTRLAELTDVRPKPLVEIGGRPVLWHILKLYAHHGVKEFVICLGYRGWQIRDYFINYAHHDSDLCIDMRSGRVEHLSPRREDWKVWLVDTGEATQTGGRLRRVRHLLEGEPYFHMTYGDGVGDVDIGALTAFHLSHGRAATVTAVAPPGRFGALACEGDAVTGFREKPDGDGGTINGGFFVLHPQVIDRIDADDTVWEQRPLGGLAADGQLRAYRHGGFWQPMDTLRDREQLEQHWSSGRAPWKVWA